jgi:TatD DNase family protein
VVFVTTYLIDSHCHLDLEPLRTELPEILREACTAGVQGFVVPGVHPRNWRGIAAVAAENREIFPAFGIHPMHAECVSDQVLCQLSELGSRAVAIGEIGLDPAYPVSLEQQEKAFRAQLQVAVTLGLPVLVHCRRSFQRLLKILHEEHAAQVGGIMHAFSGSVEMAHDFIRLGFAISISGTVTWNKAVKPLQLARDLPLEQLVLETDAPDMTPQRHRGAINRPAWLREAAEKVAELRGISQEEVARVTTENVRRILRLESLSV